METKERIKEIICDKTGIDPLDFENKENPNLFYDLGFDSLDVVEILMEVEVEFDISILDHQAEKWETLDDIVNSCQKS